MKLQKKTYVRLLSVSMVTGLVAVGSAQAKNHMEYVPGDFHQHSLYTDGSYPFMEVMGANADYGLGWWANSEHGGARNRDGEGDSWLDTEKYPENPILGDNADAGYMYRWQSLRDFVYPDIQTTREEMPDKIVISGLEQNVPGHEHCSTAIHQYDGTATAISEFEYRFDRSDKDTSRNGENSILTDDTGFGSLAKTNEDMDDAILGVQWMQALVDQGIGDAWVVPAHVERAGSYIIEDFRNWMDVGPDVAVGMEGAPGHQTSGDRGFSRGSLGGGTYGGTGFYVATIGGLWDGLLAEGRHFFNFASSDYHNHWSTGGSDFWPGEYQKHYTYIDTSAEDKVQAVFDGVHSGNSYNVQGDLIDELEFTTKSGKHVAMMGETLQVKAGDQIQIKIKVHDPVGENFCPLDMNNPSLAQVGIEQPLNMPVLHHIDLIAGSITGYVPETNYDDVVATDYGTDAAVVETFYRYGGKHKNGYMTYVYNVKVDESMYVRLRGTNLPADVPYETDEAGNPLADSLANDNIYSIMDASSLEEKLFEGVGYSTNSKLDAVAEAYADLWFYSNPIFIEVVENTTVKGKKAGRKTVKIDR